MTISRSARSVAFMLFSMLAGGHARQQPNIGLSVPSPGTGPFVFDTAEQHKIRVSVVTKGLVLGAIAEFERARIAERVRAGHNEPERRGSGSCAHGRRR